MMSLKSFCVTPRIENWVFCPARLPLMLTFGTNSAMSKLSSTPRTRIWSPVNALTEMLTSWISCSRFWAVTTNSSKTAAPSGDATRTDMRAEMPATVGRRAGRWLDIRFPLYADAGICRVYTSESTTCQPRDPRELGRRFVEMAEVADFEGFRSGRMNARLFVAFSQHADSGPAFKRVAAPGEMS